ncbi:MAG TPA: ATP-binding protein [Gemmataceae bacterium]|nr:ATP-binding protein [Gemmataceae bacterium]
MSAPLTQPDDLADGDGRDTPDIARPPEDLLRQVQADVATAGGEWAAAANREGAIGATMFDLPGSEDNTVTVLLPREQVQAAPSQALVRIRSRGDDRSYLGIVTAGPFAEPDTLRADSHLLVTVTARGGIYLPPYHGRVQVTILGEELSDGTLAPPRLRPLPNSPVFALTDEESAAVLRTGGDLRLGLVVGHRNVVVNVPSDRKEILPRHMVILGTTGAGKTTTVGRLVQQAQAAGMAVILLDVEGEYTHLHESADHPRMLAALAGRGLKPAGVPADQMTLYHLVGRETANPHHPRLRPFSLQFAYLSPYTAMTILGLSEAQEQRFLKAYDIAKELLRDLGIFPQREAAPEEKARQERIARELDEFERGYPRLTLALLMDVVAACLAMVEKSGDGAPRKGQRGSELVSDADLAGFAPSTPQLRQPDGRAALLRRLHSMNPPGHPVSWRALLGRLGRLQRLRVFDSHQARPLNYQDMLRPGAVSVLDLSDSGASELNNLVIADVLRGVQQAQEKAYRAYEKARTHNPAAPPPPRVLLIIEEAHEFLSAERIEKMKILFEQVARVAKRGRKRWLSLALVTQLPAHLPRQVLSLVNNYILHKLADPQVITALRHTIGGIDESLWSRLPGLAPGQAIVSFGHMARPLLVSIDPAPCKLRMVD